MLRNLVKATIMINQLAHIIINSKVRKYYRIETEVTKSYVLLLGNIAQNNKFAK